MKTTTSSRTWLTNTLQIDHWARIRLALLSYQPGSSRPDDCGGLYIAPITHLHGCDVPAGQLAIYATTNGDPIRLGYFTDGELQWVRSSDLESGMDDAMLDVLRRADWQHPTSGEGYSFVVEDAITSADELDELNFLN